MFLPIMIPTKAIHWLQVFEGGPNSNAGQFRDQLTFLSDSIGAIILCLENADHFWNNEGETKQLFQYSVDTAMAQYNIDPDFIYLTGLSYGGRHAAIVSMDTDDGSIPNLRGVIPFAAGSDNHLMPNYTAIGEFAPACICIGLDDSGTFINVSNTLHNDIQSNGGESVLNEIPNVGHTVAFATYPEEMMECYNFIESQYDPTSIAESEEELGPLKVYPNPANKTITFEIPKTFEVRKIQLMDSTGKLVMVMDAMENTVDVSSLASGVYNLIAFGSGKEISQQVIVKH